MQKEVTTADNGGASRKTVSQNTLHVIVVTDSMGKRIPAQLKTRSVENAIKWDILRLFVDLKC